MQYLTCSSHVSSSGYRTKRCPATEGGNVFRTYDIGFDPGNSETAAAVSDPDGKQVAQTFPSFASRGDLDSLVRFRAMTAHGHITRPIEVIQADEHILAYHVYGGLLYYIT